MENKRMKLSIFSIGGLTQINTVKLQGNINGQKVLILIDDGEYTPYCVKLGDGH